MYVLCEAGVGVDGPGLDVRVVVVCSALEAIRSGWIFVDEGGLSVDLS